MNNFYLNKFSVRSSSRHGLGVFANEDVQKGILLESCIPYKISITIFLINLTIMKIFKFLKVKYSTNIFKYLGIDIKNNEIHVLPTMFMYANHTRENPNIKIDYSVENQTYNIYTSKNIKAGEEVLLTYALENFFYKK